MNIAGTDYNISRRCLEIYFRGCNPPHCGGCHNQILQNFIKKDNISTYKKVLKQKIKTNMIDEIWLLGGEPLDQNLDKLENLLQFIKFVKPNIKIWLWTKYTNYQDIKLLYLIDYVKTGKYIKKLPSYIDKKYNIELASINQKIIKIIRKK